MTDWETCPAVESVPGRGQRRRHLHEDEGAGLGPVREPGERGHGGRVPGLVPRRRGVAGARCSRPRGQGTPNARLIVRILFDQGTPAPLRQHLGDHAVDTVAERRWSELGNGDLIARANDEGYDVLVTTDQTMRYQQNLTGRRLAIVVLLSTAWPYVRLRTDEIRAALSEVRPGEFREVPIRGRSEP